MQEKEIETIKVETKKLLDKFSKALDAVKNSEEWNVEREEDRRKDGEGKICDKDLRKIMLDNAPNKSEDFILAERKKW
jgi:Asp-tRNA(Asn)/Glu-tRNA(Gln) amidotransferase C subunit